MTELRCFSFLEPENHQVVSICIDLNLASQSFSWEVSKEKLQEQVRDYMADLSYEDPQNHLGLFPRPAPLSIRLKYYLGFLSSKSRYWKMEVDPPRPFVTFSRTGVDVDLPRFFASRAGQEKLAEIKKEDDRLFGIKK